MNLQFYDNFKKWGCQVILTWQTSAAQQENQFQSSVQISRLTAHPCCSVIKVRDVIVGVTAVTLGGVIGDAQVVKPRKKDQDSNNQDWDGAITVLWVTERRVKCVHRSLITLKNMTFLRTSKSVIHDQSIGNFVISLSVWIHFFFSSDL